MGLLDLIMSPPVFIPLIFPGLLTSLLVTIPIIWFERKVTGKVQMRFGPLYASKRMGGFLQVFADAFRYSFAEVIIPRGADRLAFVLAPALMIAATNLPLATLPAGPEYYLLHGQPGLLITLVLYAFAPIVIITLAWASNNKFSLIGGAREGYLMMTYEAPLIISAISVAMIYGDLDLVRLVELQGPVWGIVANPLAAATYLIAMLISTSKFPFEISEAETEIVYGPYTEYSGMLFMLLMGGSYTKLFTLSYLFALIFLGGWHPFGYLTFVHPILPGLVVLIKAIPVMCFAVFLRAVYARLRLDQAIDFGWSKLVPMSVASLTLSIALITTRWFAPWL